MYFECGQLFWMAEKTMFLVQEEGSIAESLTDQELIHYIFS